MKKSTKKRQPIRRIKTPKHCFFCEEKKEPSYTDAEVLRRFISERGKIVGRVRSGVCARHQRRLTLAIKHARHLAILSFLGH
ncbi:MAG: 30S ribosomal protein S18 [Candidatus Levybacteria bacterium]|nr:30S ribosomal protein S18 [Candidatus Levybacteria bacterium]